MCKTEMIMRGSTALESANALFRRAQAPANAERLSTNIWDGVTATRSTRRWLHRGRAFAVAPSSFALDIPHVAFSTGEGICQRKAESSALVFFHCESSSIVNHLVKNRPGPGRRRGDALERPHGRVPCHLAVN